MQFIDFWPVTASGNILLEKVLIHGESWLQSSSWIPIPTLATSTISKIITLKHLKSLMHLSKNPSWRNLPGFLPVLQDSDSR